MTAEIRDLLYFDVDRISSIYSQLGGGLVERIESSAGSATSAGSSLSLGVPGVGSRFESGSSSNSSRSETRVPHHSVLLDLEERLTDTGALLDLNQIFELPNDQSLHDRVRASPFIRCRGLVVIEDYERMKEIAASFNDLTGFIALANALPKLADDPRGLALLAQINAAEQEFLRTPEGKRDRQTARLTQLYVERTGVLRELAGTEEIPEWLVSSVGLWVDLFMSGRLSMRFFPLPEDPAIEVLANLNRRSLLDDLVQLRLAYGSMPNLELTVVGAVTSVPAQTDTEFDPAARLGQYADIAVDDADSSSEAEHARRRLFEKGFRGLFPSIEALERLVRFADYPVITVAPLAIYRDLGETNHDGVETESANRPFRWLTRLIRPR